MCPATHAVCALPGGLSRAAQQQRQHAPDHVAAALAALRLQIRPTGRTMSACTSCACIMVLQQSAAAAPQTVTGGARVRRRPQQGAHAVELHHLRRGLLPVLLDRCALSPGPSTRGRPDAPGTPTCCLVHVEPVWETAGGCLASACRMPRWGVPCLWAHTCSAVGATHSACA